MPQNLPLPICVGQLSPDVMEHMVEVKKNELLLGFSFHNGW